MSVSLMHLWHDSCVGEWFLTPSLWLWSACEWVRGEWMHPRSDLLPDICYLLLSVIWWMWLCVQYTSFTTHWGHPSVYIWYSEASPLDFIWGYYLLLSDLFLGTWLKYWILYLNLNFNLNLNWTLKKTESLFIDICISLHYHYFFCYDLLILIQCNIFCLSSLFHITLLLYLFTGLFKLSRVFFLQRQVLEGNWVMGEECN